MGNIFNRYRDQLKTSVDDLVKLPNLRRGTDLEAKEPPKHEPSKPSKPSDNPTPVVQLQEPSNIEMTGKSVMLSARIDEAIVTALKALPGKYTDHVRQALVDYLGHL